MGDVCVSTRRVCVCVCYVDAARFQLRPLMRRGRKRRQGGRNGINQSERSSFFFSLFVSFSFSFSPSQHSLRVAPVAPVAAAAAAVVVVYFIHKNRYRSSFLVLFFIKAASHCALPFFFCLFSRVLFT